MLLVQFNWYGEHRGDNDRVLTKRSEKKNVFIPKEVWDVSIFFSLAFNLFSNSELALVHSPNSSTKDSAGYRTLPYFLAEVPPMLINLWATGVTTRFGFTSMQIYLPVSVYHDCHPKTEYFQENLL